MYSVVYKTLQSSKDKILICACFETCSFRNCKRKIISLRFHFSPFSYLDNIHIVKVLHVVAIDLSLAMFRGYNSW